MLDDVDRRAVYIAEGLGHGFCALTDDATLTLPVLVRGTTRPASTACTRSTRSSAIDWPAEAPLLSARDEAAPEPRRCARRRASCPPTAACRAYEESHAGCGPTLKRKGAPATDQTGLRAANVFCMDRRIFGLETEYGVTCTYRGQRRLSPDEVARYLFRRVVSWGRSSNVFLRNGARLYLDVGSHPEYATPECDSVARPGHARPGRRADPRGPAGRRREAAARRGHRRRDLPVQEQHRLGRQLLRLPRELPGLPARRVRPAGRRPHPVPGDPAAHLRRRQGAADAARRGVLPVPAGRAHLGGRVLGDHPVAGRSSTPATSRTPTPSATGGCTSSSATRT